jgi:hypothetical protein
LLNNDGADLKPKNQKIELKKGLDRPHQPKIDLMMKDYLESTPKIELIKKVLKPKPKIDLNVLPPRRRVSFLLVVILCLYNFYYTILWAY